MMNEQQLEDLCIGWFQETGWQFVHGPDIAPDATSPERADYRQVLLRDRLLGVLARINPHIPAAALEQAAHIVQTINEPQAVVRNRSFHRLLLSGVAVEFSVGDDKKTDLVHLIDFANPQHNEFLVINQFTVTGTKQPRRPDLVAFINGLPLAVIELKNPANEQTDRLLETLRKYHNRAIETAQVIEELIQMAKDFQAVLEREAALGLGQDEIAFYDALANNESAVRELGDDILKKIAIEITEKLRASTTVDWQVRESVRARLRILVRRTLQKWKYPPPGPGEEDAVELVLKQAESLSNEWSK